MRVDFVEMGNALSNLPAEELRRAVESGLKRQLTDYFPEPKGDTEDIFLSAVVHAPQLRPKLREICPALIGDWFPQGKPVEDLNACAELLWMTRHLGAIRAIPELSEIARDHTNNAIIMPYPTESLRHLTIRVMGGMIADASDADRVRARELIRSTADRSIPTP